MLKNIQERTGPLKGKPPLPQMSKEKSPRNYFASKGSKERSLALKVTCISKEDYKPFKDHFKQFQKDLVTEWDIAFKGFRNEIMELKDLPTKFTELSTSTNEHLELGIHHKSAVKILTQSYNFAWSPGRIRVDSWKALLQALRK